MRLHLFQAIDKLASNQSNVSSDKFKAVLGQIGSEPQNADKMKIAFAEGE